MSGPRRILALALVALAMGAAAGCGGDEEGKGIPAATANDLFAQLDDVKGRLDQGSPGACRDILEAPESRGADKEQVQDAIDSLPDDVDPDVKSALQDSFDHLWDLIEQECEDKESERDTNTTPIEPPETTPTETTETTPTETTETTPPAEEELPGGEGDGEGDGGGGDGNGGGLPGVGDGGGVGPSGEEGGG